MRHKKRSGRRARVWLIDGVELTAAQIAKRAGMSLPTFYRRLSMGWAIERITAEPIVPRERRFITCNGEMHSVAVWARKVGIPQPRIRARLNAGWSPEEAIGRPLSDMRHTVSMMGQEGSIAEWSKITGIAANIIFNRLHLGWPIKRALTEPVVKRPARKRKPPHQSELTCAEPGVVGDFPETEGTGGGASREICTKWGI
jgi:hypothetical protein